MCISSTSNQYIKHLQQLIKLDNKNTEYFYLENYKNIIEFLKQQDKYQLQYIFLPERNINSPEYLKVLDYIKENNPSIKIIDNNLWDKINNLPSKPRLIATFSKPQNIELEQNKLLLILDNIQDPGNVGSILRVALATYSYNIICTKGTANIYSSKVLRSSASSISKLNIVQNKSIQETSQYIKENNYYSYITSLQENSISLEKLEINTSTNKALILGNEGHGISPEWQELLNTDSIQYIKIPMNTELESLNVAVSSALCLYRIQNII